MVGAVTVRRVASLRLDTFNQRVLVVLGTGLAAAVRERSTTAHFPAADTAACYDGGQIFNYYTHTEYACYHALAMDPHTATTAPVAFRPLVPYLVHALPLPTTVGFHLVTAVCVAVASLVLFDLLARERGGRVGLLAVVALWLSGAVEMPLLEPDIADGAVVLAGALALWLGRRGRWWAAALAVAVGVSAHELAVAFAVGLVVAAWPVLRRGSLLLLLPSVAVYWTLHFTPLLYGHMVAQFPTLSVANLRSVYALQAFRFGHNWVLVATVGAVWTAMGALWLLIPLGWRRAPRYYRGMTAAMPVAALSCVLVADWPRVLGVAALTLVPVVCYGLPRSPHQVEESDAAVAEHRGNGGRKLHREGDHTRRRRQRPELRGGQLQRGAHHDDIKE